MAARIINQKPKIANANLATRISCLSHCFTWGLSRRAKFLNLKGGSHSFRDTLLPLVRVVADSQLIALPDFERPPVVETVLSAQFERIQGLRAVHWGLFWRRLKDRFPTTEERPPLHPVFERFPDPLPAGNVRFEAIEMPELPRLWLHNAEQTELIQVQSDRFITNWRKRAETDPYPHYEPVIKPTFDRDFAEFKAFLSEEELGSVRVNQCEVTYVNHIVSGEGWDQFGEADQVFSFLRGPSAAHYPGRAEDFSAHLRFPITHGGSSPIGRLHVNIQPAFRGVDGRPMYVMNMTARGQFGPDTAFFDIGRRWIVESFEQLTTSRMHEVWRKK